ncbi:MAG: PadR family transcriptional regulator [bacterium]|nr:PadR family transcriptional regulator [bacterium]
MSLPNVLLSLLREPMCGTDLVEQFRSSIRHFWTADLSQIYRALEGLERAGCVRSRSVPSPKGPARRIYSLTAAGREKLIRWVEQSPELPPLKLEYLAQLFSATAAADPVARAREQLGSLLVEAQAAVRVLEGIECAMQQVPGYPDRMPASIYYPWLTLRHGLHRRRALVAWVEESLASLERRGGEGRAVPEEELGDLAEFLQHMADAPAKRTDA